MWNAAGQEGRVTGFELPALIAGPENSVALRHEHGLVLAIVNVHRGCGTASHRRAEHGQPALRCRSVEHNPMDTATDP